MKILIGCLYFKTLTGSELYFYELAKALCSMNHEVYLICTDAKDSQLLHDKNFFVASKIEDIQEHVSHFDVCIISHWNSLQNKFINYLNLSKKVINICHSEIYQLENPMPSDLCDAYIAIRPSIKNKLINEFGIDNSKIHVIYNPIDTSKFNRANCENENFGLFVGSYNLARYNAIQHFGEYCKDNHLKSVFIGEGFDKIDFYDLSFAPNYEIDKFIKKAKICAGINYGRTYWEAKLCGKKTIEYMVDSNGEIESYHISNFVENWIDLEEKLNPKKVAENILAAVTYNYPCSEYNQKLSKTIQEAEEIINFICKKNKIDKLKFDKLKMQNIDLISMDTMQPYEAIKSMLICSFFCDFGNKILLTNLDIPGLTDLSITNFKIEELDIVKYSDYCYHFSDYSDNDFVLIVQHDSFIINPNKWDESFLDYDYIGAVWPYESMQNFNELYNIDLDSYLGNRVGNGGFSLRSKKFLNYSKIVGNAFKPHPAEDLVLCLQFRNLADSMGIKFAPSELAENFSYEYLDEEQSDSWLENTESEPNTFGFHQQVTKNHIINTLKSENKNKLSIKSQDKDLVVSNQKKSDLIKQQNIKLSNSIQQEQKLLVTKWTQKLTLNDVKFVIFIDDVLSKKTSENLIKCLSNLNKFFDNQINVVCFDKNSDFVLDANYNLFYYLDHKQDVNLEKTFKKIISCFDEKYILILNHDVIYDPRTITEAYEKIKSGSKLFSLEKYNKIFLNEDESNDFESLDNISKLWKHFFNLNNSNDLKMKLYEKKLGYMFDKQSLLQSNIKVENFTQLPKFISNTPTNDEIIENNFLNYVLNNKCL